MRYAGIALSCSARQVSSCVDLPVVRRRHETDGRQILVALSDTGRATVAADRRRRDAWLAQRLRELTTEERTVLRNAAPIIERLAHA